MTGNEYIRGRLSARKFKDTVKSKTLSNIIKTASYIYEQGLGSIIFGISDEAKTASLLGDLLSYK